MTSNVCGSNLTKRVKSATQNAADGKKFGKKEKNALSPVILLSVARKIAFGDFYCIFVCNMKFITTNYEWSASVPKGTLN